MLGVTLCELLFCISLADARSNASRALSYIRIAGYEPNSDVVSHSRIDLDQKEMEEHMSDNNFSAALSVYLLGGNSGASALITISPIQKAAERAARVTQGSFAIGYLEADAARNSTNIHVKYLSACKDGGLAVKDTIQCFSARGGPISIGGTDVGIPAQVQNTYLTLQSMSVKGQYEMGGWLMQENFAVFRAYYGSGDYAHQRVLAGLQGTGLCSACDDAARIELAKKSSAYMSVWMYVIRAMEDAILHCRNDCINCKYIHDLSGGSFVEDRIHAWDEAVAYYVGSLEGPDGTGSGRLLYALADRHCPDFGTCTTHGCASHQGEKHCRSAVNTAILDQFRLGQYNLMKGKCIETIAIKRRIVELMSIPLIQGSLLYAYKLDKPMAGSQARAAGAAFSAAILPRIAACNIDAAKTISDNMNIDLSMPMSSGFALVKQAFESTYSCLGISCEDVGGLRIEGSRVWAPCGGSAEDEDDADNGMPVWIPVLLICGILVWIICCGLAYMFGVQTGWKYRKMSCTIDNPENPEAGGVLNVVPVTLGDSART